LGIVDSRSSTPQNVGIVSGDACDGSIFDIENDENASPAKGHRVSFLLTPEDCIDAPSDLKSTEDHQEIPKVASAALDANASENGVHEDTTSGEALGSNAVVDAPAIAVGIADKALAAEEEEVLLTVDEVQMDDAVTEKDMAIEITTSEVFGDSEDSKPPVSEEKADIKLQVETVSVDEDIPTTNEPVIEKAPTKAVAKGRKTKAAQAVPDAATRVSKRAKKNESHVIQTSPDVDLSGNSTEGVAATTLLTTTADADAKADAADAQAVAEVVEIEAVAASNAPVGVAVKETRKAAKPSKPTVATATEAKENVKESAKAKEPKEIVLPPGIAKKADLCKTRMDDAVKELTALET
jgi:hypothetical protein